MKKESAKPIASAKFLAMPLVNTFLKIASLVPRPHRQKEERVWYQNKSGSDGKRILEDISPIYTYQTSLNCIDMHALDLS